MAEFRPPLLTYMFSDPLIYKESNHEEQDVESLDIEKEIKLIKSAISTASCTLRWVAKVATEQNFVSSYCCSHVFHFTGHGIDGSMAFETETGQLKFIDANGLREMCKNLSKRPKLLFLSMCHGKTVGLTFAELGVEHVVTVCNDRILDKASLLFADQFYRAVLSGNTVRDSFEQGLARLQDSYPEEKAKYFLTGISTDHSEVLFSSFGDTVKPAVIDETLEPPASNCNEVTSFFTGRRKEIFDVYRALINKNRVVSLTGPRGIGKSQISLACASYCRTRHTYDAILYWEIDDFQSYTSLEFLIRLCRTFSVEPPAEDIGIDLVVDRIREKWKGKAILVLIDGINRDDEEGYLHYFCTLINSVLKKTRDIFFVTTSREPLSRLKLARIVPVGPLKDIYSAELFVHRSPRNLSVNELTQLETDLVCDSPLVSFSKTTIIQNLKGNPLVIEHVARETEGRNLLLHRTDFIMNIIPQMVSEVSELPDKPPRLSRSVSERLEHSPSTVRSRSTSASGHTKFLDSRSSQSRIQENYSQIVGTIPGLFSESYVESQLYDAYLSVLGDERPLSPEEIVYLKSKFQWDDHHRVSESNFTPLFAWYVRLLNCFKRSDLWHVPNCIYGFINRVKAKQLLSEVPNSVDKKVCITAVFSLLRLKDNLYRACL